MTHILAGWPVKTSAYLDDPLKVEVARVAELTDRSEAELIRQGISVGVRPARGWP
ncbi:MAG: hypothetical protein LBG11_10925 [Bifidobacteriaceae bacterium]|jgi:predicted transcriptional regulator|nr:hypothetical protein [Bifidobacteriaceae bacterium]